MSNVINKVVKYATFGLVDDITGSEAAAEASQQAAGQTVKGQQDALNYLQEKEALPMQYRDASLGRLAGFFGLGDDSEAGYGQLLEDPYIKGQINSKTALSEDAILRNASATGGLRSGNVNAALASNAPIIQQQVIDQYLNHQIGGLEGLAGIQSNDSTIANLLAQMGATRGQGTMGAAQSENALTGALISGGLGGLGAAFSDKELKENILFVGIRNGYNWYKWQWNEKAKTLGLTGTGHGILAQEVEYMPGAVVENAGYKFVNYAALGV